MDPMAGVEIRGVRIAGVRFHLHGVGCVDDVAFGPEYAPFLCGDQGASTATIDVVLSPNPPPDLAGWHALHDSEDAWSIHQRDGERYVHGPGNVTPPEWGAIFGLDTRQVTVFARGTRFRAGGRIVNPATYPLDLVLMMYGLAAQKGAIVHAAGVMLNEAVLVFPARSGSGKSTLARQFEAMAAGVILSDDRIVVRGDDRGFSAFGTPWLGEARLSAHAGGALKALIFLKHAAEEGLRPVPRDEVLTRLLPVVSIPWYEPAVMGRVLDVVERMVMDIPAYELGFTPTVRAAEFLIRTMDRL